MAKKVPADRSPSGARRARRHAFPGSRVVSATSAAKSFGALVDRVREEGAVYIVERGGVPVAQIGPAGVSRFTLSDLVSLLRSAPTADARFLKEVEIGISTRNRPSVPDDRWAR